MPGFHYVYISREKSSHEDRSSNFYSSHTNTEMLETIMKEKKDLEKQSAHKLSLLQNQIHAKNKEIQRLEDKLEDIVSGACNIMGWKSGSEPEITLVVDYNLPRATMGPRIISAKDPLYFTKHFLLSTISPIFNEKYGIML